MDKTFNTPQNAEIETFDLQDNHSMKPVRNFKIRVSVYGVLVEDGKILVQSQKNIPNYSLPGGGVEIGERLESALIREFKEETGLLVKPIKQLETKDDFVTFNSGQDFHSILIFYLVEKVSGELIKESNGDDSDEALFIPVPELLAGKIRRVFKNTLETLYSIEPNL